ncbi:restriction endonuclease [Campylobacter sp. JMF_01 NE2]|uniref:restriction endonuclease n=1 Tax=unclassified Campylobacter TaxID=2593542 RepID=UPI0022E9A6C6|nr:MULTISPECIES: restriction endonuclease [unclassified Campylobacter]MDA3053118.1 restriction endonuclease [Campylobacter sp. JMF_03 NE3]MDA3067449.1 restriction endonuclease [Campylobacter sp. JMF_01 NE2]
MINFYTFLFILSIIIIFAFLKILIILIKRKTHNKTTYKQKIQKGKEYEYQIMQFYKNKNYTVYPKGYIEKKQDEGIDIIAYKENEILLIQCKNWTNAPKQKEIKVFITDCEVYLNKNKETIKNKTIRKIFVTSYEKIDYGVKLFLDKFNKENQIKIEYIIIQYNKN